MFGETFIKNSPSKDSKKINKTISFKDLTEPLSSTRDDYLNTQSSKSHNDETYNLEREAVHEISQFIESYKSSNSFKENVYDDLKSYWHSNNHNKKNKLENLEHEHNPKYFKLKEAKEKWTRFLAGLLTDKRHVENKLIELTNISKLAQDINKRMIYKPPPTPSNKSSSIEKDVSLYEEFTLIERSSSKLYRNRKTPYNFDSSSKILIDEDGDDERTQTKTFLNETTTKTTSTTNTKTSSATNSLKSVQHKQNNDKQIIKHKHKKSKRVKHDSSDSDINKMDYQKMYKKEYRKSSNHSPSKSSATGHIQQDQNTILSNCNSVYKDHNKKMCKLKYENRNGCICDECMAERELENINNTKSFSLREEVNFNIQDTIEVLPLKLKRQSNLNAYTPALQTLRGFEQAI